MDRLLKWLMSTQRAHALFAVVVATLFWSNGAISMDIREYAQACEEKIGVKTPGFDCKNGEKIPIVEGNTCKNAPYLPEARCYADSRIGKIDSGDKNIAQVFMCRHKHPGAAPDKFSDIALIQTNLESGATCFFQKLSKKEDLTSKVPAPDSTEGEVYFMPPGEMAESGNACVRCHDSGPFIRTPYVWQMDKKGEGKIENLFPTRTPEQRTRYWFPAMPEWSGKVFNVTVDNASGCTTCHAMGTSEIGESNRGTSIWLGPMATGEEKSPLYDKRAHWMKLNLDKPQETSKQSAGAFRACAKDGVGSTCKKEAFKGP